ncbi:MAG TPA: hypothetical protein VJP86_10650 [Vicinamibacterales bacterium]|nr:hypothetical protein [Vicinamibacterales bacterium]
MVRAHQVPPELDAYFRVNGQTLTVIARVPLSSMTDVGLPVGAGGMLDVESARPKLDAAAAEFVRSLEIADGDSPLRAPAIKWIPSPARDRSFLTFERAAERLRSAAGDKAVDAGLGFLDVQLDYALSSPSPRLSVRFNGLRAAGTFLPSHATYITNAGEVRTFTVEGPPQRIAFEPSWPTAVRMFARLGLNRLPSEKQLLLFVFCLAIPLPSTGELGRRLTMLLGAYFVAGIAAAIWPGGVPLTLTLVAPVMTSFALVVGGVQPLVSVDRTWIDATSALFGASAGVLSGSAAGATLALAGSHGAAALLAFLGTVMVGATAVSPLLRALCEWCRQLPVPASAMAAILALVPLHAALHGLVDGTRGIADAAAAGFTTSWLFSIRYWPAVFVAVALLWLFAVSRLPSRRVVSHREV